MSEATGLEAPIGLPERIERGGRLGPFPSGTAALKFLLVAAAGAAVALRFGALAWLPFLGVAFGVSIHRRDRLPPDERLADYLRFRWRRRHGSRAGTGGSLRFSGHVLRTESGGLLAGFEATGLPVAFLPPEDARRLFEGYRELLRSLAGDALLVLDRTPLRARSFLPRPSPAEPAERAAREGYADLLRQLTRLQHHRRIRILLHRRGAGAGDVAALEAEMRTVGSHLGALEVRSFRLKGEALRSAAAYPGTPRGE